MQGEIKKTRLSQVPNHYIDKHGVRRKITLKQLQEQAEKYVHHPYLSTLYKDVEELQARVKARSAKKVYPKADMSIAKQGASFQTQEQIDKHLAKVKKSQDRLRRQQKAATLPKGDSKPLSPQQKAANTRKQNKAAKEAEKQLGE